MPARTITPISRLTIPFAAPPVDPPVRRAFDAASLQSLRVGMIAKIAVMGILAVFLALQFRTVAVVYWYVLLAVLAGAGVWQYRLMRRHARAWIKYAFMALDIVLLTFAIFVRNPLIDYGDDVVQVDLRFDSFLYYFIPLALSALTFTPRFVLFTGLAIALVYAAAVTPILLRPETLTILDMPNYAGATLAEKAHFSLHPYFVSLSNLAQQIVIVLLVAMLLTLAVARQMRLVVRQIGAERERAALARYFSPNMVDELAQAEDAIGEVRAQPAAVLFADMVGFTALSERLGPVATMALLRDFHGRMAAAVFAEGGTVDKYIGDSIMATFGTPRVGPRDARDAIACALAMIESIRAWNAARAAAGEPAVAIGIGVHYGTVVAGNMGDARRLEYAVIGDTVNVASRVEKMTRDLGVAALFTGDAVEAARAQAADGDPVVAHLVPAGSATLRGRAGPVALWAAPGATAPAVNPASRTAASRV